MNCCLHITFLHIVFYKIQLYKLLFVKIILINVFVKFNYVICIFIKMNIHRFFFSFVIIYVMSHFQGKEAIRLFETVKSSQKI